MKTKWPPRWIYYVSINFISAKTRSLELMKAYLWSTNDGNASLTLNGRRGSLQGTKPAIGKIWNYSYSYFNSRKKVRSAIAHSWLQILRYKQHQ